MTFVAPPAELPSSIACGPAAGLTDSDDDLARVDAALLADICVNVDRKSVV